MPSQRTEQLHVARPPSVFGTVIQQFYTILPLFGILLMLVKMAPGCPIDCFTTVTM